MPVRVRAGQRRDQLLADERWKPPVADEYGVCGRGAARLRQARCCVLLIRLQVTVDVLQSTGGAVCCETEQLYNGAACGLGEDVSLVSRTSIQREAR
jgi:hypothetical protein